jgi:hypothetical protein
MWKEYKIIWKTYEVLWKTHKAYLWKTYKGVLFLFIFLMVGIPLIMYDGQCTNRRHFKKFNESNIQGIITEMRSTSMGESITIDYLFEYTFLTKEFVRYNKTAAIGDSVIKPAFSRILILKKGDKLYQFTFKDLTPEK